MSELEWEGKQAGRPAFGPSDLRSCYVLLYVDDVKEVDVGPIKLELQEPKQLPDEVNFHYKSKDGRIEFNLWMTKNGWRFKYLVLKIRGRWLSTCNTLEDQVWRHRCGNCRLSKTTYLKTHNWWVEGWFCKKSGYRQLMEPVQFKLIITTKQKHDKQQMRLM